MYQGIKTEEIRLLNHIELLISHLNNTDSTRERPTLECCTSQAPVIAKRIASGDRKGCYGLGAWKNPRAEQLD
jgi:hypothetical protein